MHRNHRGIACQSVNPEKHTPPGARLLNDFLCVHAYLPAELQMTIHVMVHASALPEPRSGRAEACAITGSGAYTSVGECACTYRHQVPYCVVTLQCRERPQYRRDPFSFRLAMRPEMTYAVCEFTANVLEWLLIMMCASAPSPRPHWPPLKALLT